jgi:iron complex outermembrane recepter protein
MADSAGRLCGAGRKLVVATATLTTAFAFLTSSARADVIEEITVTAQKRSENIQSVPIAITAFTTEALQEKAVGDIHALSNLTPNVNLDSGSPFSGDSSVLSASIRGIGQDDFAFNLDPGVGVYLDGVYLARTIGANQNLLDVDRIEILKGPQGTLFGRNTIGGAISIVTHTPGDTQKITAMVSTGRFNRRDMAFTADIPVTSSLLTSISVSSQVRDGYQRVIPYPTNTEMGSIPFVVDKQTDFPKPAYQTSDANGGQNLQVARGKALWHASDAVDVTFSGDWAHQDQSAYPTTVLAVVTPATQGPFGNAPGTPWAVNTLPGPTFGFMGALYNYCISNSAAAAGILNNDPLFGPTFNTTNGMCGPRGQGLSLASGGAALGGSGYVGGPVAYTPGGVNGNPSSARPRIYWNFANTQTGNIDTTYASGPSFAKYTSEGLSGTVDWKLRDDLSFKSITGWRQIDWRVGVDLDGTPESIQEVTDHQFQRQISQEFQLNGTAVGGQLNYVTGLYYFQESGFVHDFVPFGGTLYIYDVANDVNTKSYAGFAHLDYKVNDAWGLTLGARYSRDDKEFEGGQSDLDAYAYKSSGCFHGSAATNYQPTAADLVCWHNFITTGPGKGGGLVDFPDPSQPLRYFPAGKQKQSYNVFTPTAGIQYHVNADSMFYASYSQGFKAGGWTTRLSNPIADITKAAFGPEKARTYELGLKSDWLNRHVRSNVALFYTNYTGIQLNIQEGASPVLHNAGDATLKGAELELQAVADNGLSVNVTAGYIDAKYDKILADPSLGITTANKLPKTPKFKYTIGPQFDLGLAGSGKIRFGVDYTHTAELFNDAPNTPLLKRPAVSNVNAAIHYLSPSDKYELTVGGTNLSDERYIVVGSVNGAEGETVGTYSRPREWYLSLKAKL